MKISKTSDNCALIDVTIMAGNGLVFLSRKKIMAYMGGRGSRPLGYPCYLRDPSPFENSQTTGLLPRKLASHCSTLSISFLLYNVAPVCLASIEFLQHPTSGSPATQASPVSSQQFPHHGTECRNLIYGTNRFPDLTGGRFR